MSAPTTAAEGGQETCSRTVVLSRSQRVALEGELAQLGVTAGRRTDQPSDNAEAMSTGKWEVYYDTADSKLTIRGWWLRQQDGEWLLRVPKYAPEGTSGIQHVGYEEITDPEDILRRVGLVEQAEAYSKGLGRTLERLFNQVGVVPFARIYVESRVYHLRQIGGHLAADSGQGSGAAVSLAFDNLRFDTRYAENEAVSQLLFTHGTMARECLQATVAEFRQPNCSDTARAELDGCLRARGFNNYVSPRVLRPNLAAYFNILRPVHFRRLHDAGVIPVLWVSPTPWQ
mmetsp:Transcript_37163/g.104858  ORF Transcript_37163/g.104858 Transcript_37163/m.104858 type:complete len:286 (-) Transcript_37163:64-921(-)